MTRERKRRENKIVLIGLILLCLNITTVGLVGVELIRLVKVLFYGSINSLYIHKPLMVAKADLLGYHYYLQIITSTV